MVADLGEILADRLTSGGGIHEETFSVSSAPDIIYRNHPSLYLHRGNLFCGHKLIRQGDMDALYDLIDMPDAKLTRPQAIWLYRRLYERAATFSEDKIAVSSDYVWNRETGRLEKSAVLTTNDERMKRNGRMGQGVVD